MSLHYWQYFLAIEKSLVETERYIEIASMDNYQTYSIEFARILLSASSEVDVICKLLCKKIDSTKTPKNINEYREIITNNYCLFFKTHFDCLIPKILFYKSFGFKIRNRTDSVVKMGKPGKSRMVKEV